jgi:hypothetical protein
MPTRAHGIYHYLARKHAAHGAATYRIDAAFLDIGRAAAQLFVLSWSTSLLGAIICILQISRTTGRYRCTRRAVDVFQAVAQDCCVPLALG